MPRRSSVLVAMLAVVLGAGSCGGASDERARPAVPIAARDGAPEGPRNEYQRLAQEALTAPGPSAALRLFALQYGPLPDVEQPRGDAGPAQSGTLAIAAVFGVWGLLSVAQQDAVRAALELPSDYTPSVAAADPGTTTAVGGVQVARPTVETPGDDVAPYGASLRAASTALQRHLGRLGLTVTVTVSGETSRFQGEQALADAVLLPDGTCRIRVFPRAFPPPSGSSVTMAHELVHCYQQAWRGGVMPRSLWWVQEGIAEWAGNVANAEAGGGADPTARAHLNDWIGTPTRSLLSRTYDAWPWFAYVEEKVGGLWGRVRTISTASGPNEALRAAIGGDVDASFASEWATSEAWRMPFGASWYVSGAAVPVVNRRDRIDYQPLANGARVALDAPALATNRTARRVQAEVVRFEVAAGTAGVVRAGGQDRPIAELVGRAWCTHPGGVCTCPPGTRRAGETLPQLEANELYVAVAGGAGPTQASLAGRSLREECGERAECPVGQWRQDGGSPVLGAVVVSGGTGAQLTITGDGRVVQDFSEYVPITATADASTSGALAGGSTTVHIAPSGFVTARLALAPPGVAFTSAEVLDVDASALVGEGYTEVDLERIEFSVEELRAFVSGLVANRGALGGGPAPSPVVVTCPENDELVIDAGRGVTQRYVRVGR